MKLKKYIAAILSCAALTGCQAVDETLPAYESLFPSDTATESAKSSETEKKAYPETEKTEYAEKTETSDTQITVRAGGEPEEPPAKTETAAEAAEVESISLSTYSVTLQVGQSRMPIVTMHPENASDKSEIWTSSDESVAVVDGLGNITAVSEGSCTVTVTSAQNRDVSAEVEVNVLPSPQVTYIDGILVVNKTYTLPADYAPGVNAEAKAAFEKMQADAAEEDLNIYISSGYRSYEYQAGLYQRYVDKDGKAEADRYSARPGHSEHQTGLAFDLNTIDNSFAETKEGKWVLQNCYKYGFIIRYPADKEDVTGYMWEPWHIRYLGVETAKAVYDSGLCLEEYLGITSKYSD